MTDTASISHDIVLTTFAGTTYGFMLAPNPDTGTKYFIMSESSTLADKISEGEASYSQTNPEQDLVWVQDDWTGCAGPPRALADIEHKLLGEPETPSITDILHRLQGV